MISPHKNDQKIIYIKYNFLKKNKKYKYLFCQNKYRF